jgi:hypothetical protein
MGLADWIDCDAGADEEAGLAPQPAARSAAIARIVKRR